MALQINILEAVKLDAQFGHEANARVGIALAAAVKFKPRVDDHELVYKLGKEWIDAYIAWNLAFVLGDLPANKVVKLLIPSVVCPSSPPLNGDRFFTARIISSSLALMSPSDIPVEAYDLPGIDVDKLDDIKSFLKSEIFDVDAL
eukprot:scaffold14911_cov54-Attheya_sp.AAC.2